MQVRVHRGKEDKGWKPQKKSVLSERACGGREKKTKGWMRMAQIWDRAVCSSVNRLVVEEKRQNKGMDEDGSDLGQGGL